MLYILPICRRCCSIGGDSEVHHIEMFATVPCWTTYSSNPGIFRCFSPLIVRVLFLSSNSDTKKGVKDWSRWICRNPGIVARRKNELCDRQVPLVIQCCTVFDGRAKTNFPMMMIYSHHNVYICIIRCTLLLLQLWYSYRCSRRYLTVIYIVYRMQLPYLCSWNTLCIRMIDTSDSPSDSNCAFHHIMHTERWSKRLCSHLFLEI